MKTLLIAIAIAGAACISIMVYHAKVGPIPPFIPTAEEKPEPKPSVFSNYTYIPGPKKFTSGENVKVGITLHSTANFNSYADAKWHGQYMDTTRRNASWHFTVCGEDIVQHYPIEAITWHGGEPCNSTTISIEMCDSDTSMLNMLTTLQTVDGLIAQLREKTGQFLYIQEHKDCTGKNCPSVHWQSEPMYQFLLEDWNQYNEGPLFLNPIYSLKDSIR